MGAAQVIRESGSLDDLRQLAEAGFLFAITDATADPAMAQALQGLEASRAIPLRLEGIPQQDFLPYVIAVDPQFLAWLQQNVWSKSWGVLLTSSAGIAALAEHLARFLIAKLPDGEPWFFRYYDPRVLAQYLPNCTAEELADFTGPVRAYVFTDTEDGNIEVLKCEVQPVARVEIEREDDSRVTWEIRSEHIEALQSAAASFDVRAAEHLMQYFPEQCRQLGTAGLHQAIDYGINRAAAHGFSLESNVCVFLDLLFTFGLEFDTQVPWAKEILDDATLDETQKAEKLFQKAAEQVQTAMQGQAGGSAGH